MYKAIKILLSQAIASEKLCNYSSKRCPDQLVGYLKYDYDNGHFKFFRKVKTKNYTENVLKRNNIDSNYCRQHSAAIILVLESPHVDEYDDVRRPIGPAYGLAGNNINEYLEGILDKATKEVFSTNLIQADYDLIIMNAIQYQCSLGADTRIYRDAMFLYYWEKQSIRESFKNRIDFIRTAYDSYMIINCCTKGEHIDSLTNHFGSLGYYAETDKEYFKELGVNIPLINTYQESNYSLKHCVSRVIHDVLPDDEEFYLLSHPSSWDRDGYPPQVQKFFRGIKRNINFKH